METNKIAGTGEEIKDFVVEGFKTNWVFQLYAIRKIHHWIFAVAAAGAIFLVGGLLSALLGVFPVYVSNWTLYLNLIGIALAFIAFGWFTDRLPKLLSLLADLFESNKSEYRDKITEWGKFANKNWRMVVIGAGIAAFYLVDTVKYWKSPNPPILLVPWVESEASTFFAIFYGFLHVIVVPFILGSGIYGMYGVVRMLGGIFNIPIDLVYYRRAEDVVRLTGWLLMWGLIGWSSIVIFGRPLIFLPVDIPWIKTSGLFLSVIATLFLLVIGSGPLMVVGNAIETAKSKERKNLERKYQEIYKKFSASVTEDQDEEQKYLWEKLRILDERIKWIDGIPAIPIRWPSILRISFGVMVSVFSPFAQDWLLGHFLSFLGTS